VATEEEAEEVAELLRRGTDLAWLAGERSIDRLADSGGDRGWRTPQRGQVGLDAEMMDAQPGDVFGPLGGAGNFVVLKVMAREEQGTYAFEEVSGNLRQAVESEKFRKVLDEFITKLRSRSDIEINEEVLARLNVGGSVVDEPSERGHGAGVPQ
jgi:parvulin-like peptidyl-prolyl isomerase